MEGQFSDRILSCSDCHGEFIFTAGEQLFFHDKQFKNDPKRCKPCKSRRSGLTAAANGSGPAAAGLSRTETRTKCSDCGIETTVPFKPTQGRPVLCRQCFQSKNRAAAPAREIVHINPLPLAAAPAASAQVTTAETVSTLTQLSTDEQGGTMSREEAVMAAASMASASPQSSVASAADLASISGLEEHLPAEMEIPMELLAEASAEEASAALVAASVEAPEA